MSKNLIKIKELEEKCAEYLNGWQRAQADYHNLKKETEKKMSELREYVQADMLLELISVFDHFKLALKHIPDEFKKEEWLQGFLHIKNDFKEFLKKYEISEIETVNTEFNPEFHEAISQEPSEQEENIIIKELKPGYTMNGKVIKPAQVIVSQGKE